MRLPVACVEIGVPNGIATMEHPAIAHIDAHMRNAGSIVSPGEEHEIAGAGAVCAGADVVKPLRSKPPEVPAALVVDIGHEAGAVKGCAGLVAAPHIGIADVLFRLSEQGGKGFVRQIKSS